MKFFLSILFVFPLILCAQITLPPGFMIETIAAGLQNPTSLTIGQDERIFVTEKNGAVRVIQDDILLPDPLYTVDTETFVERGLLNLILHPDFDNDPKMYLFYTVPDVNHNRLLRIEVNGNSAILGSDTIIMDLDPMSSFHHNGGGMATDDDGHIFLAVGDGTNAPQSQNLVHTSGKLLRMNLDGSIPTDNPFYNVTTGTKKAIWARGLRNPFTMAKHESSGTILFNDVGEANFEEVNEIEGVANYGWPLIEGPIQGQVPPDDYFDPVYYYEHDEGCAIVGSCFYETDDQSFPIEYHDKYLFMDYCQGWIRVFDPVSQDVFEMLSGLNFPIDLEVDHHGDLYVIRQSGHVLKISYSGTGEPFIIQQPQDAIMALGENLEFEIEAGGDPLLSYQWFENATLMTGETNNTLGLNGLSLTQNGDQFHCQISNALGAINSDTISLTVVDGTRPNINIVSPFSGVLYSGGDSLLFAAQADDTEDGVFDPDSITWVVDFHHNVHKHPVIESSAGLDSTWFNLPTIGELAIDVFYRMIAKVKDSDGLTAIDTLDVYPEIVTIIIDSNEGSIAFSADASTIFSGDSIFSVKGMQRSAQAPDHFVSNDTLFGFDQWANGSQDPIQIYLAKDTLIEAQYTALHEYIEGENSENLILSIYTGSGENKIFHQTLERETINENVGHNSPIPGTLPVDSFGLKYQGSLLAPFTGLYTIYLFHDGFASLSSEGYELINNTFPNWVQDTDSASVYLNAGTFYNFQVLYENYFSHSRLKFSWSFSELDKELVPPQQLYYPDLDLSLTKEVSSTGPFLLADEVTFQLKVKNQGSADVTSVTLIDHIPEGMTLADPDWNADGTYDLGHLEAKDSALVDITLSIDLDVIENELINIAEILAQTNGADIGDIDSSPDDDPLNDAGGSADTASDNAEDGNGTGSPGDAFAATDEDDHDPAKILICNSVQTPIGLQSTFAPLPDNNPNTFLLSWDPIPGTSVCQIKGGPVGGNDGTSILIWGSEPSEQMIYTNSLTPGQTYQWNVRCACSIDPDIIASELSAYDLFTIPLPALVFLDVEDVLYSEENNGLVLFINPNPNEGEFLLYSNLKDHSIRIFDISGNEVYNDDITYNGQHDLIHLDLSPGVYIIKAYNSRSILTRKMVISQ